jgi:hypothetical protein
LKPSNSGTYYTRHRLDSLEIAKKRRELGLLQVDSEDNLDTFCDVCISEKEMLKRISGLVEDLFFCPHCYGILEFGFKKNHDLALYCVNSFCIVYTVDRLSYGFDFDELYLRPKMVRTLDRYKGFFSRLFL